MKALRGYIKTDSWAGRFFWRCEILGETPKRYRVRLLVKTALPRGWREAGTIVLVPHDAVTFNRLEAQISGATLVDR